MESMGHYMVDTKLQIPQPHPGAIYRARLTERLNAGMNRRLTFITAPAGFGKSTLLSTWIHSLSDGVASPPVAWVSLDRRDNDATLFWSYVIAAIQRVLPQIGEVGKKLLRGSQPCPPEYIINSLINDLAKLTAQSETYSQPALILILDDYQEIDSSSIHHELTFFLESLPPGIHCVIASRIDPDLPLARWRARDQMTEIRGHELRFLPMEVSAFFCRTMAIDLSETAIDTLADRTEGWIAGLQLAALSLREHSDPEAFIETFGGTHRHIFDYLLTEVCDRLTEEDRIFLFSTSILKRLNGSLCDAVTLRNDSQSMLERFDRQNLFLVPLDNERHWYRYHHLFAETLQKIVSYTSSSLPKLMELHKRAAEWYYQHKMTAEAIEHALAGEDYLTAARWIEEETRSSIVGSNFYTLRHWLEMIPEPMVQSMPWLCLSYASALLGEAKFHEVEPWLRATETALSNHPPKTEETNIYGWIDAVRATLAINFGDEESAIFLSQSALQHLTDEDRWARAIVSLNLGDAFAARGLRNEAEEAFTNAIHLSLINGNSSIASVAMASLGVFQARQGRLHLATDTLKKAAELPDSAPFSGKANIYLSEIYLEWNMLAESEECALRGISLCQQWGHQEHILDGYLALAYCKWAQGKHDEALKTIVNAEEILENNLTARLNTPSGPRGQQLHWRAQRLAEYRGEFAISVGDLAAAETWAKYRNLNTEDIDPWHAFTFLKLLIAEERFQEAHRLLKRILKTTEPTGFKWPYLYARVLQTVLLNAEDRTQEALPLLMDILLEAEPEDYCRLFINEGQRMLDMLKAISLQDAVKGYIQQLIVAAEGRQDPALHERPAFAALPEPLTEREREILGLLATGKTNPEIAAELFLAVGTVKKHISNIYGKLGVKTRTQALLKKDALKIQ